MGICKILLESHRDFFKDTVQCLFQISYLVFAVNMFLNIGEG